MDKASTSCNTNNCHCTEVNHPYLQALSKESMAKGSLTVLFIRLLNTSWPTKAHMGTHNITRVSAVLSKLGPSINQWPYSQQSLSPAIEINLVAQYHKGRLITSCKIETAASIPATYNLSVDWLQPHDWLVKPSNQPNAAQLVVSIRIFPGWRSDPIRSWVITIPYDTAMDNGAWATTITMFHSRRAIRIIKQLCK